MRYFCSEPLLFFAVLLMFSLPGRAADESSSLTCSDYLEGKIEAYRVSNFGEASSEIVSENPRESALMAWKRIKLEAIRVRFASLADLSIRRIYAQEILVSDKTVYKLVHLDLLLKDLSSMASDLRSLLSEETPEVDPMAGMYSSLLKRFGKSFDKDKGFWPKSKIEERESWMLSEATTLSELFVWLVEEFVRAEKIPTVAEPRGFAPVAWVKKKISKHKSFWVERSKRRMANSLVDSTVNLPGKIVEYAVFYYILQAFLVPTINQNTETQIQTALSAVQIEAAQQRVFFMHGKELSSSLDVLIQSNRTFRNLQKTSSKDPQDLWKAFELSYLEVSQRLAKLSSEGEGSTDKSRVALILESFDDSFREGTLDLSSLDDRELAERYGVEMARSLFLGAIFHGQSMTAFEVKALLEQVEDFESFNRSFRDESDQIAEAIRKSLSNFVFYFDVP